MLLRGPYRPFHLFSTLVSASSPTSFGPISEITPFRLAGSTDYAIDISVRLTSIYLHGLANHF